MNRIILLTFTLLLLAGYSIAQSADYVPMLGKSHAGWYQYLDLSEVDETSVLTVYTDADTTVGGLTYTKLKSDWHILNEDEHIISNIGSYREDVTARKIYQLNSSTDRNQESLIYDFSAQPGETISIGLNAKLVLKSIDHTIDMCGQEIETDLRVFHLVNPVTEEAVTWIEGVGSTAGISANTYSTNCKKFDVALICKMSDDEVIYHYDGMEEFSDCPFSITSSGKLEPEMLAIRMFPNPAQHELRVRGNPEDLGNAVYRIFNITGQEMKKGRLDYSTEAQIDVSGLQNGAYFIEIYNQERNKRTNQKLIIAR